MLTVEQLLTRTNVMQKACVLLIQSTTIALMLNAKTFSFLIAQHRDASLIKQLKLVTFQHLSNLLE
jgi:hypothetical protein